jgi:hypothetical protein
VDATAEPALKAFAVGVTEAGAAMAGIAMFHPYDRRQGGVPYLWCYMLMDALSIPIVLVGSRYLLGKWSVWGVLLSAGLSCK